ncbi:MAG TPA: hypothetical protein VLV83_19855 [Acidobacteriota bacterium]|nr:hypothetical protein [Acidobacteriota bacterium]
MVACDEGVQTVGKIRERLGQARECRPSSRINSWRSVAPRLAISGEAIEISELLLSEGVIPPASKNDALHIGIAAAQGADFLLTWNFRHINNAEMKASIGKLVDALGFLCPQIRSPEELGGGT